MAKKNHKFEMNNYYTITLLTSLSYSIVMKIRTCPLCNYKYSISDYIKKILFKFIFSEWNCQSCNKKITFDFKRRMIVALCFGGLYIIITVLISILKSKIEMTPLLWLGLLLLYIIGSIFIFTFDTFKAVE